MKSIAMIGIRGIPVVYSGFETFAEELSVRLVKRGYKVRAYCRKHAVEKQIQSYKGVGLVYLPSIMTKSLDTISHSLVSTLHACLSRPKPDVIYYLGVGSSICSFVPRMFGIKTVVNVDGLDWKRGKWGRFAQLFLLMSERVALFFSNVTLTDSRFIQKYYMGKYRREIPMIPYGYSKTQGKLGSLKKYELEKSRYLIWSGRLVPDNHLDELIKAYLTSKISLPLIILGDSPNQELYKERLHKLARKSSKIKFLGFVDRMTYAALIAGCRAYIETKRSGGTHPSLVESMGHGCLIVANDHASHQEVLGETAVYYPGGEVEKLSNVLKKVARDSFESQRVRYGQATRQRAQKLYSWDSVVNSYEKLFGQILS